MRKVQLPLPLVLLAGMAALLAGIVPSAQLAEAGQDQELLARAEAGDANAQVLLGVRLHQGTFTDGRAEDLAVSLELDQ